MPPVARFALLAAASALLAACGSDKPAGAALTCDLANTGSTLALGPLQGARVTDSACVRIEGVEAARYLVVPQYATQGSAPRQTGFFLGNEIGGATTTAALATPALGRSARLAGAPFAPAGRDSRAAQHRLDARLRAL